MKIIKSILISLLFIPLFVFAQNQAILPSAGFTPESPFYFIDKLGEALREFFTFNPEGKARLQITFAAERVAEIKIILETKGVEAKGLEVAQSRLQAHLANAAIIVTDQKSKGKDVSTLAKELDDKLETPKSALADSFNSEKRALEAKENELKTQLKAAHRAGDAAKEEALAQELGKIKAQKELLELKEEDIEDELEAEEEKLEEEMEAQHKAKEKLEKKQEKKEEAEEAIQEAEEEKQEVLNETSKDGIELPATAFAKFDRLLAQAKELFIKENYQGAKQLAEQAEDTLEDVDKEIEKPEKEKENKEEQIKDKEEEEENQSKKPSTFSSEPCHITNDKRGCARKDFNIISPNGGEEFCIGENMNIQWKVPKDVETVTLKLREAGLYGKEYNIGTFPSSYNETGEFNGEGDTIWKIGGVKESMVYEVWINAIYKGSSVNDVSDRVFSIFPVNCR